MTVRNFKITPGVVLLATAYIVPAVWWALTQPEIDRSSTSVLLRDAAKISAVLAMVSFAVSPLLSAHHGTTDRLFHGLDKSLKIHKKVGISAVVFGLLHPIFLTAYFITSDTGGFSDVWSLTKLVTALGIVGLFGSIVVVGLTRLRKISHQSWIRIHRLLGWFLLAIIGHLIFSRGDIYANTPLYIYLLGFSLFGFAAFIYQSVLNGWIFKHYRYEVAEVNAINESVTDLVVKPIGPAIHYEPGQYAYVRLDHPEFDNEPHPFSFATNDNGPYVRFGIKSLGDYTAKIRQVPVGTKVELEGPYGRFNYRSSKADTQIWIAGGVGITPFLSMARSIPPNHKGKIVLMYGFKDAGDAAFLTELQDIALMRPDTFSVHVAQQDLNGFVDIEKISAASPDYKSADYFVCGPPGMMHAVKGALSLSGVKPRQIHSEEFSF